LAKKKPSVATDKVTGNGSGPVKYAPRADGLLQISVDFALAPSPGTYFYADSVSLKRDTESAMAVVSFGRSDLGANRFTERIEIVVPQVALFSQFWNSARSVEGTLDEVLKLLKLPISSRSIMSKARARATLYANTISVALGNGESCLDFYYMPVRDIHYVRAGHISEIGLEPIVRILSSPVVLKTLFDLCRPHATAQEDLFEGSGRANAL
jgi:hypothetical protein